MTDYDLSIQVQMDAEEVLSGLQQINEQLANLPGSVEINFAADDAVTAILENIQENLNNLPEEYNINITAEDSASEIVEDIKSSIDSLSEEYNINVSADDSASDIIENIRSSIESLPEEYNINITAEDNASEIIENIMSNLEENTCAISIQADDEASATIENIKTLLESLPEEYNINITAEDNASEIIEDIKSALESISGEVSTTITVEDEASNTIEDIQAALESIPEEISTVIQVEDNASDVTDEVSSKLDELDGKEVTATISVEGGEEATNDTQLLNLSMQDLGDTAAAVAGTIASYDMLVKGLNYRRAIEMAKEYTNATEEQGKAMEELVQKNMSAQLGMEGTARVMTLLARYTGDANEAMGYFKAVMDAIKVTGEDSTAVTITLMNTFREFGVTTEESYEKMAKLIQLFNVSGYPSFTQFLSVVDRIGLTLMQMGFTLEDVAGIVASVGPQGTMILRGFTSQLYALNSEWVRGTEEAEEYARKLEAIGIATRDAEGNIRPLRDVIFDFINYLQTLPSHEERVKVATEIFGDTMGRALVSIAEGYGKVEKASQQSAEQQIKDIKKVKKETRDPLTKIKVEIEKLIPSISKLAPFLSDLVFWFSMASGAAYGFMRVLSIIDKFFAGGKISEWTNEMVSKFLKPLSKRLPTGLGESFKSFMKTLGDEIKKVGDFGAGKFTEFAKRLGSVLKTKLPVEIDNGTREGFKSFAKTLRKEIVNAGDNMVGYLDDFAKMIRSALGKLFGKEGGKISITFLDDFLDDFAKTLATKFPMVVKKLTPYLSKVGGFIGRALGEGIIFRPEDLKWSMGEEEYEETRKTLLDWSEQNNKWMEEQWSKFTSWVSSKFADFKWPRLPNIQLPDLVGSMKSAWSSFTSWVASVFAGFKWPALPNVSLPDLPGMIQGIWVEFTSWVAAAFPTFVWPSLPDIKLPDLLSSIQSIWTSFTGWVSTIFPTFKWPRLPNIQLPDLVGSMKSACSLPDLPGMMQSLWIRFTSWVSSTFSKFKWPRLPNVQMPDIGKLFSDAWKKFTDTVSDAFKRFKWPKLPIPNFGDIAKKFYDWGRDFINNLVKGIWDAMPSFQKALAWIKSHLPHSPPEVGPLADVTRDSMRSWMEGIVKAGEEIFEGFAAKIGSMEWLEPPTPTIGRIGMIETTGAVIGGAEININISEGAVIIRGQSVDERDFRDAAQMLGDEIVRSVISEGINVRRMRWG